jgi:hypothetical protein
MSDKAPHMNDNQTFGTAEQPNEQRARSLTGGLTLILIGIVILGHGLGWPLPENWWALFILIPIAPKLIRAAGLLARGNALAALRALGSSLMLMLIAVIFLLNLDWEGVWPVFLILGGVLMLLPKGARRIR